ALPGRKVIHTNGPRSHANRVLGALGLDGVFEAMVTIEDTALLPKPERDAHETAVRLLGLDAAEAVMIDDMAHNLTIPQEMGMRTVWLHHGRSQEVEADHVAEDLQVFLGELTGVNV
ncbi:MAG: HAD-IA family hydrolase, partial [Pseudomonadota bacterium]